jgi:Tol biopolymer transport system component
VRGRFLLAAGLTSLLLLAGCGGSGTAIGPDGAVRGASGLPATAGGTMLIVKGDNIFSMDVATKQDEQLTHESNSNFANNPAFSPDGTLIAYTHHVAPQGSQWGGAELHVMNADGSGDRTLAPAKDKGERAETPSWSPDGKSIYFAHDVPIIDQSDRYTGDTLSVDKVDLASGDRQVVVKDAIFPSMGKTGLLSWVLYNTSDSSFKLMVGAPDGSQGRQLLSEKDFQAVYSPELSPDGKSIVFAGSGRTNSKVASVGATVAAALNPLVPGTAEAHGLPWDPWIIGVDGGGLKRLASIGSDEMALVWSPDGQEIAFSNLSSTYLMRPDGSGLTRLLPRGDPGGLDWKA